MKFVVALAILIVVCAIAPAESDRKAIIVRESSNHAPDHFQYFYQTSNGIQREEVGEVKEIADNRPVVVRGTASWVTPDGTPVQLEYVADETGYHPTV